MRQTNIETKRYHRNKKEQNVILFNSIGKGCALDKSRMTLMIEVV